MKQENLEQLISQGLASMIAGSRIAAQATAEIINDATHSTLKQRLESGQTQARHWLEKIERAQQELTSQGEQENKILKAHFEVSKKIRENAADEATRDLGIIAAGQMALHYWIASFGTIAAYAEHLELQQTLDEMSECLEQAKVADQELSQVAMQIFGQEMRTKKNNQSANLYQ